MYFEALLFGVNTFGIVMSYVEFAPFILMKCPFFSLTIVLVVKSTLILIEPFLLSLY